MARFRTQHGIITVDDWGYQLQGRGGNPLSAGAIARQPHDLIVMDYSATGLDRDRFSPSQIDNIQDGPGGESVVAAYLSIGEASDFRSHWRAAWTKVPKDWDDGDAPRATYPLTGQAPDWLGPTNEDWPESRKVRYWDDDWQNIIFNDAGTGWLDRIVQQGFDAAYLDIVDAYYYWGVEVFEDEDFPASQHHAGDPKTVAQAAVRMMKFVIDLTEHARETNPDFFAILQNGAFIIADAGPGHAGLKARFRDAVGAIAVEDTYFRGNREENNHLQPDREAIDVLQQDFLHHDIPVFAVDYINRPGKVQAFEANAIADGFIPYAAPERALDRMGDPVEVSTEPSARFDVLSGSGGNDRIHGLAGPDVISGGRGEDRLFGDAGADTLRGGGGDDTVVGGSGADRLVGNGGNDRLAGGARSDVLIGGSGSDALFGGGARDVLSGGSGRDRLVGGPAADTLAGGGGNDFLRGGPGNDMLSGGGGADRFVVGRHDGHDTITDFQDGVDRIDLGAFGFSSVAAAKSRAYMDHGDAHLVLPGGTEVIVEDTPLNHLTGADLLI